MRKKEPMTGWFDPAQLIRTGIRVFISTIFGQFADKREALAAANFIPDGEFDPSFNYSEKAEDGEFWFDYMADTGDGWTPTFAVAGRLAEDSLQPEGAGEALKRGRLLVLGGDEVYPTASREEYDNRFLYPFDEAFQPEGGEPAWPAGARPDLYAVPGNHDWYDGLRSFFHLFCRRTLKPDGEVGVDRPGTVIGGRQTWQTRSYFALKLPGNWWLWGTDSQLEGYIDQPQIDYFQYVANQWMDRDSNLILCVGTPDWECVDVTAPETNFSTFSYLERLAGLTPGKTIRLRLVLSGDSHHYSRYQEASTEREGEEGRPSKIDYVVWGGGGATLHPTHHLWEERRFCFAYPPPGVPYDAGRKGYDRRFVLATKAGTENEKALYPSKSVSCWMTFGTLLFPFQNWKFPLFLTPFYLLFIWLLDFNAQVSARKRLPEILVEGGLGDAIQAYWSLAFGSPWPVALLGLAWAGYYYLADVKNTLGRLLMGGIHALLHAAAVTVVTCLVIDWTAGLWEYEEWWKRFGGIGFSMLLASLLSAWASGFVIGIYFTFSLVALKRHWAEAYPAMRLTLYKGFLRMKIDKDGGLTVYPIGLRSPSSEPELIEPALRFPPAAAKAEAPAGSSGGVTG